MVSYERGISVGFQNLLLALVHSAMSGLLNSCFIIMFGEPTTLKGI